MVKHYKLLLGFMLFVCGTSNAQVRFGAKAGLNFSRLSFDDRGFVAATTRTTNFMIGGVAELDVTDLLFFQSGLSLTMKGGTFSVPTQTSQVSITNKVGYIELPINVGIRLPMTDEITFVGMFGPYLDYGVFGNTQTETQKEKIVFGTNSNQINRFDYGVSGAIGTEFNTKMQILLHYSAGLGNVYNLTNVKSHNGVFGVSLVYFLKE